MGQRVNGRDWNPRTSQEPYKGYDFRSTQYLLSLVKALKIQNIIWKHNPDAPCMEYSTTFGSFIGFKCRDSYSTMVCIWVPVHLRHRPPPIPVRLDILQAPLLQLRRTQQGAHSAGHDAPQRQMLTAATWVDRGRDWLQRILFLAKKTGDVLRCPGISEDFLKISWVVSFFHPLSPSEGRHGFSLAEREIIRNTQALGCCGFHWQRKGYI